METKARSNIARALQEFIDDKGILDSLVWNFASEQTGKHTNVMRLIRQSHIKLHIEEKDRGITQNHWAETEIREIKTKWKSGTFASLDHPPRVASELTFAKLQDLGTHQGKSIGRFLRPQPISRMLCGMKNFYCIEKGGVW